MKLPDPRGFSASSFTATICDSLASDKRRKAPLPQPICFQRDTVRNCKWERAKRAMQPKPPIARQLCTVELTTDARKIFLPTGKTLTRKNGKTIEEKMMVLFCSSIVTVQTASGGTFTLTTTNKGPSVKDSRMGASLPPKGAEQILESLCSPTDAAKAYAHLLACILPPKVKPAAPVTPASDAERTAFAEFMKPRPMVRHPNAKEEKVDVTEMSNRQFAAFNRKQSAQSAAEMDGYLSAGLPADWMSRPVVHH